MSIREIGCCGAVCKTCPPFKNSICRGCKTGYENGERDINRAKCVIKLCCIGKRYGTCADCTVYESCAVIKNLHGKKGYKYKKYRESIEYIRTHGYEAFLDNSVNWRCAYGKLE